MLLKAAFRPPPTFHTLGLRPNLLSHTPSLRLRPFTTSPANLLRRLPHQQPPSRTATFQPARRHPLLLTTLTLSTGLILPYYLSNPIRNDLGVAPAQPFSYSRDAKTPLTTDGGRTLNPRAIRQISMGSIVGLGLGVLVSAFSKMLVLVLGLGIVVTQFAARKGYSIIPVESMQRYAKGVNLRSAVYDNAAFKISFGLMFALTAFAEF